MTFPSSEQTSPTARPSRAAGRRLARAALAAAAVALLAGCASVPLSSGAGLTSTARLGQESGSFGKTRSFADKQALAAARTVRIVPTTLSAQAASRVPKAADRVLVSNAIDRATCIALSDRFEIVAGNQPADLSVHSIVADIVPTDKVLAGASVAVSLGSSFVLPVGAPRLPLGLGGLSMEGEALDRSGQQVAALVWAKGANSLTTKPRVSDVGDAYALASSYGGALATLLAKGTPPPDVNIAIPSGQRVQSFLGGKPKYAACDAFGRQAGIPGFVSGMVGAPPEWTDPSARAPAPAPAR